MGAVCRTPGRLGAPGVGDQPPERRCVHTRQAQGRLRGARAPHPGTWRPSNPSEAPSADGGPDGGRPRRVGEPPSHSRHLTIAHSLRLISWRRAGAREPDARSEGDAGHQPRRSADMQRRAGSVSDGGGRPRQQAAAVRGSYRRSRFRLVVDCVRRETNRTAPGPAQGPAAGPGPRPGPGGRGRDAPGRGPNLARAGARRLARPWRVGARRRPQVEGGPARPQTGRARAARPGDGPGTGPRPAARSTTGATGPGRAPATAKPRP
jgi:translation initiation factor IF-2